MRIEDDGRIEAIWEKQRKELAYWVNEHLGPLESKNISIHEIDCGGGQYSTILFDQDARDVILIHTDTTATTPELSHKYMMIQDREVAKLAEIFNLANKDNEH